MQGAATSNDVCVRFLSTAVVQDVLAALLRGCDDRHHILMYLQLTWQIVVSVSVRKLLVTTCVKSSASAFII